MPCLIGLQQFEVFVKLRILRIVLRKRGDKDGFY